MLNTNTVTQLVDYELYVNNKRVYKDPNGNWVTTIELTPSEQRAFQSHIQG